MTNFYVVGIIICIAYFFFNLSMIVYHGVTLFSYLNRKHQQKWRKIILDNNSNLGLKKFFRMLSYMFNKEDMKNERIYYLKMRVLSWYRSTIYFVAMLIFWIIF